MIRHADTPPLGRRAPTTSPAPSAARAPGRSCIVGDVDISDPELVGPARARRLGPLRRTRPTTPPPTRPSSPTRPTASSSGRPCAPTPASARPRRTGRSRPGVLSHTLTYHERCPAAEWHLLQQRSSYAGHGRSYGRGDIFRGDGQLAASFVQDAMIRARSGGAGSALIGDASASGRAAGPAGGPASRPCSASASCTAAAPGTSRYACGSPAITWSSQGTPAWLSRWA